MQLFDDVPVGSLRFFELAEGHEGISYQLSKFNEIGPVRPSTSAVALRHELKQVHQQRVADNLALFTDNPVFSPMRCTRPSPETSSDHGPVPSLMRAEMRHF